MPENLRVLISSTAMDLGDHRKAVADAVLRLEHLPITMEHFGAISQSPLDVCREKVLGSPPVWSPGMLLHGMPIQVSISVWNSAGAMARQPSCSLPTRQAVTGRDFPLDGDPALGHHASVYIAIGHRKQQKRTTVLALGIHCSPRRS